MIKSIKPHPDLAVLKALWPQGHSKESGLSRFWRSLSSGFAMSSSFRGVKRKIAHLDWIGSIIFQNSYNTE
jgi:hypothetical protein